VSASTGREEVIMRVDTGPVPSFTPSPPPRPVYRRTVQHPKHAAAGVPEASTAEQHHPPLEHPLDSREERPLTPRARVEARRLTLAAFAVAVTALLMPFTALVSLALAVVGHAKGDEKLGSAAFLASLAAMAAGFALNLTVIDVAF
jgi:hypothetical protein